MTEVKTGDRVKIHYTGKLEDGSVFDCSDGRPPLDFVVGNNQVIKGMEKGLIGMVLGDKKTIRIPPEEAYGQKREDMVARLPKDQFPDTITPAVGEKLQIRQPDGNNLIVTITEMDEETVTLDGNHPLAGETLLFDVELVEIS